MPGYLCNTRSKWQVISVFCFVVLYHTSYFSHKEPPFVKSMSEAIIESTAENFCWQLNKTLHLKAETLWAIDKVEL